MSLSFPTPAALFPNYEGSAALFNGWTRSWAHVEVQTTHGPLAATGYAVYCRTAAGATPYLLQIAPAGTNQIRITYCPPGSTDGITGALVATVTAPAVGSWGVVDILHDSTLGTDQVKIYWNGGLKASSGSTAFGAIQAVDHRLTLCGPALDAERIAYGKIAFSDTLPTIAQLRAYLQDPASNPLAALAPKYLASNTIPATALNPFVLTGSGTPDYSMPLVRGVAANVDTASVDAMTNPCVPLSTKLDPSGVWLVQQWGFDLTPFTVAVTRGTGDLPTPTIDGVAVPCDDYLIYGNTSLARIPAASRPATPSTATVTMTIPDSFVVGPGGGNWPIADVPATYGSPASVVTRDDLPATRIPVDIGESADVGSYYHTELLRRNRLGQFRTWTNNDGTEYDQALLSATGEPTAMQSGKTYVRAWVQREWTVAGVTKSPGGMHRLRWRDTQGEASTSVITIASGATASGSIVRGADNICYQDWDVTANDLNGLDVRITNFGGGVISDFELVSHGLLTSTAYWHPTAIARRQQLNPRAWRPMWPMGANNPGCGALSEMTPADYLLPFKYTTVTASAVSGGIAQVTDNTDLHFPNNAARGWTVVEITTDGAHAFRTGDSLVISGSSWTINGTSLNGRTPAAVYKVDDTHIRCMFYLRGALVSTGTATLTATRHGGLNARRAAEMTNAIGATVFWANFPITWTIPMRRAWETEFFAYANSNVKLYFAVSNEPWNYMSGHIAQMRAEDEKASLDGTADLNRWLAYDTEQTYQDAIANVPELIADPTRIEPGYEWQAAGLSVLQAQVTWAVSKGYTFYWVGGAGYVELDSGDTTFTPAKQLDAGASGCITAAIVKCNAITQPWGTAWKTWADAIPASGAVLATGRTLTQYEANLYSWDGTESAPLQALYAAIYSHDRMEEAQYHRAKVCQDIGYDAVNLYTVAGRWVKQHYSEALPHYDSTADNAPSYRAMVRWGDATAPTLQSIAIGTNGLDFSGAFSEPVTGTIPPILFRGGAPLLISGAITNNGDGTFAGQLDPVSIVYSTDTIKVNYSGGDLADAAGNLLLPIVDGTVDNSSEWSNATGTYSQHDFGLSLGFDL